MGIDDSIVSKIVREKAQQDASFPQDTEEMRRRYKETISRLTGIANPPKFLCKHVSLMSDEEKDEAHCWWVNECEPPWSTGIGAWEAADHIITEAIANANIRPDGEIR